MNASFIHGVLHAALIALAISTTPATLAQPPQYHIVALGTLGGPDSSAYGVNNQGQVVGEAQTGDGWYNYHAFLWPTSQTNKRMKDLGTLWTGDINLSLPGPTSHAKDINDTGQIIGYSSSREGDRAFIYTEAGGMISLGTLGAGGVGYQSFGAKVNKSGQSTGESTFDVGNGGWRHAFRASAVGIETDLTPTLSKNGGGGKSINDHGDVVGFYQVGDSVGGRNTLPFFWDGTLTPLPVAPDPNGSAQLVTNDRRVYGYTSLPGRGSLNCVWTKEGDKWIKNPIPTSGIPAAVNQVGNMVGGGGSAWVFYEGTQYNLNTLAKNLTSTPILNLSIAWDINDRDWIVGEGTIHLRKQAFLAIPITATPTLSPKAGAFVGKVLVTLDCASSGADIRYTLDGSEPTAASLLYSTPFELTRTATVKTRAFKEQWIESEIASNTFTITKGTTEKPTFEPSGGSFSESIEVVLKCATPQAAIRYTTDGSEPSATSALYGGTLTLRASATVKARAFHGDYFDSPVASATFTRKAATPIFTVPSSSFVGSTEVTIDDATPGAIVRFTVDGADPSMSSPEYSGPILITSSLVLKARAFLEGGEPSDIATVELKAKVARPEFQIKGGNFADSVEIVLSSATQEATIRYTTNGEPPTLASSPYVKATVLAHSATVRAKAFVDGMEDSEEVVERFTIESETCVWRAPVASLGNFGDPSSWEDGRVPQAGDKAVFGRRGAALVTLDEVVTQTGRLKAVVFESNHCTISSPQYPPTPLLTEELVVSDGASLGMTEMVDFGPDEYPMSAIVTERISIAGELRYGGRAHHIRVTGPAAFTDLRVRVGSPASLRYGNSTLLLIEGPTLISGEIIVQTTEGYAPQVRVGGTHFGLMSLSGGPEALNSGRRQPVAVKNPDLDESGRFYWGLFRRNQGAQYFELQLALLQKPDVWRVQGGGGLGVPSGSYLTGGFQPPKPKLFLLTHGTWSTVGAGTQGTFGSIAAMAASFLRVNAMTDWEVATMEWGEYSTSLEPNSNDDLVNPATSAEACVGIAESLVNWMTKQRAGAPFLEKVQVGGHSSASWFVQRFGQAITANDTFSPRVGQPLLRGPIQLTFFDAFVPPGTAGWLPFFGRFDIGALGYGFNGQGDFVEHYVHEPLGILNAPAASLPGTNATLPYAKNVDVTQATIPTAPGSGRNLAYMEGHSYPYIWYLETLRSALISGAPLYRRETDANLNSVIPRSNLWGFGTSMIFQEVATPALKAYREEAAKAMQLTQYGERRYLLGNIQTALSIQRANEFYCDFKAWQDALPQTAQRVRGALAFGGAQTHSQMDVLSDGSMRIRTDGKAAYTSSQVTESEYELARITLRLRTLSELGEAPAGDATLTLILNEQEVLTVNEREAGTSAFIEKTVMLPSSVQPGMQRLQLNLVSTDGNAHEVVLAEIAFIKSLETPLTCPFITEQPESVRRRVGEAASFKVKVDEVGNELYQWYKDDAPIPGATLATLILDGVTTADLGSYRVRVASGGATVESVGATLDVETRFSRVAGSFAAVLPGTSEDPSQAGFLTLRVAASGSLTGKLKQGDKAFSVNGYLGEDGVAIITLKSGPPRTLTIQMESDGRFSGSIEGGGSRSTFSGGSIRLHSRRDPSPFAGRYSGAFELAHTPAPPDPVPLGNGFATIKVLPSGMVRIVGKLADDSKVSFGGSLSSFAELPFYLPTKSNGGTLSGVFSFDAQTANEDLEGTLSWYKPPSPPTSVRFSGSRFVSAKRADYPLLGLKQVSGAAAITLHGGGLDLNALANLRLSPKGDVVEGHSMVPTFSYERATGFFRGSFRVSPGAPAIPFQGVLIQKQDRGTGYFRNGSDTGLMELAPLLGTPGQGKLSR